MTVVDPDGSGPVLRIDPHVHTAASYDAHTSPETLVGRAREVGLDGLVVTDHDTVAGARAVVDLATGRDLVAIVGCEVSTADGHLLAIGIESAPEPGRPLPETARRVREAGGVAVVPHPFQRSRHGAAASAIEAVDGVEVYNAHGLTGLRNEQARRFAERKGYPAFGGSDAHRGAGVGRAATEVALPVGRPPSADAVLEAMRAGRTAAVGRRTSARRYLGKIVGNATYRSASFLRPRDRRDERIVRPFR